MAIMANKATQGDIDRPLTMKETIITARAFLLRQDVWVVNNYNCLAALLALGEAEKPDELYLIARDDAQEDMPILIIDELSKKAKGCRISLRFIDSFLKPGNTDTDRSRRWIMADKSLTYDRFYGYLDAASVTDLPTSIISLGLAIKNAADSEMISSLQRTSFNSELTHFNLSVSTDVAVHELKPLNDSFDGKRVFLTFPYLADEWVDNVKSAIDALLTGRPFTGIYFPKSLVTRAGVWRLAHQLVGVNVENVGIELCETWKHDEKVKESIEELLKTKKVVEWNVDWLYGASRVTQ